MSDRGAKALALALTEATLAEVWAPQILGKYGLFIPDVSEHEPLAARNHWSPFIRCCCGWEQTSTESYFDHLNP